MRTVAASTSNSCADAPHPSPLTPHLSPLTPHSSPLTPHPSPWKALTPAVAKYKDWASKNQDAAFVAAIEISFDPTPLASGCGLPPPPPARAHPHPPPHPPTCALSRLTSHHPCSIGGVEVTGFGGKINLNNTLQSRLMLAYETRLPALRSLLFG